MTEHPQCKTCGGPWPTEMMWQEIGSAPKEGPILVAGGIAHWHEDQWKSLTGFEYPGRPIEWEVKHWMPIPVAPNT